MAGVSSEQGGDKLNTELNLVPFIDLLSTLVLFLLVTAVWLQVAAIPASVDSKGKASSSQAVEKRLLVHINASGYQLTWPSSASGPGAIARGRNGFDLEKLANVVKAAATSKTKTLAAGAVSADDSVEYAAVVEAIDVLKANGLTSVALSTD
jgi:biopolymer transport protein TolR